MSRRFSVSAENEMMETNLAIVVWSPCPCRWSLSDPIAVA
jgi:hypothetical protein